MTFEEIKAWCTKNSEDLKKTLWLAISGSLFCFLLIQIQNFLDSSENPIFAYRSEVVLFGFFLLIAVILFTLFLRRASAKQKLRNQPSWFYYFYWGLILGLGAYIFLSSLDYYFFSNWLRSNLLYIFLIETLLIINASIQKTEIPDFVSFASGAVGKKDDELNFTETAENVAKGLESLKDYVSVAAVYGGMGFGKSSFVRMVIENFDKEETFYTYISLTETNEARDFSKLFAERWNDAISERYPKIDIPNYLPLINNLLRENGQGFWSSILQALTKNFGLLKTFSKTHDHAFKKKTDFVSQNTALIFGNIPKFIEKRWIIVIDEIERAQLDEIYRVVEMIERFKNEGRTGLPINLIFIFCISRENLEDLLTTFKKQDVRAYQLENFFSEGKSITHTIFLPPTEESVFVEYVVKKIKQLSEKHDLKINLDPIRPFNFFTSTSFYFFNDPEKAKNYLINLFIDLPPRVINRISQNSDFFLDSFRNKTGIFQKNYIRWQDIFLMEYIKIYYPSLIDFFNKTINKMVVSHEQNNLSVWELHRELKDNKSGLLGWIEKEIGRQLTEKEKTEFPKFLSMIANFYFDFSKSSEGSFDKQQYEGTLSYAENLKDYLMLLADSTQTGYKKYNRIYKKHLESVEILKELSPLEVAEYERFLSNLRNPNKKLYLDVLNRIKGILLNKELDIDKGNVGDTAYDEVVYRFTFVLLNILKGEDFTKQEPTDKTKLVFESLGEVLKSPNVTSGAKFIILNSYANNKRGGGSGIHAELNQAFIALQRYYRDEINELIKYVFDEFEQKYINDQKVIYENEENFVYTMYQFWSGDKDRTNEISEIRKIAARGLDSYPEIIKFFWSRYPYDPAYDNLEDALEDNYRFISNGDFKANSLYMPLETLIEITEKAQVDQETKNKMAFWKQVKDNPTLAQHTILESTDETLKAVLIERGLLIQEPEPEKTTPPLDQK